jgi:hypothetical protein
MREQEGRDWFPAKKYGWGWGVAHCWQGALVQLSYPVLVAWGLWFFLPRRVGAFLVFFALLTVLFLFVHWVKGERPHWRWGD